MVNKQNKKNKYLKLLLLFLINICYLKLIINLLLKNNYNYYIILVT